MAAAIEASGLGKEEAANKAGYTRSAYYKHIENPGLSYSVLIRYGKAIKYDFTEEFPDMPKYTMEDPEETYGKPKTMEDAVRQIDIWKNKYFELMEKYNRLIEERMEKR